jgi:WhiB family redox-sensing transcriptional regulator
MDADAALDLLKEILAGVPRLPGAACIGRHELFDPVPGNGGHQHQRQEQIRRAEAARLCATCPAIRHCPSVTVLELKKPAA